VIFCIIKNKAVFWLSFLRRDSSVGIAMGYGLHDRGSISSMSKISLLRRQTGSAVHPASHQIGIEGSFLGGKETGE
jgi:hypothetical protein